MNKQKKNKKEKDCLDNDFINKHFEILIKTMNQFGINTPNRIKYFLAQCYHETGGFKHFKENLNYSADGLIKVYGRYFHKSNAHKYARKPEEIANIVYNGRYGNKNPGDGAKYIGRGLIQITFYDNYKKIKDMIGVDIINNPELVSENPEVAIKTACAFFKWKKLNIYADQNNMEKISEIIQGSLCTLKERITALNKIEKSGKFHQICNSMKNYIQSKDKSNNSSLSGNSIQLNNNDIYIKALKDKIKYEKDKKSNNNNNSSNTSSPSLFSLDNKDIYIKALKEQIKYMKDKEKDSDDSDDKDESTLFSFLCPEEKDNNNNVKNGQDNNGPPSPPNIFPLDKRDIYMNELKKEIGNPNNKIGGIDFSNINEIIKNCRNIKFQGLMDKDSLLLIGKKDNMKLSKNSTFVNLEDVSVILKILYDPTLKNKDISFSLDPYEPTNPFGPYMRKVFYPDEIEKRKILEGTKIGEDMFIADYLLKQMSIGYKPDNLTKFEYPSHLQKRGLNPIQYSNESNRSCNRLWVVTKKIESISNKSGLFYVNGIKLGVDARQIEISQNGTLTDKKVQNLNSPCYKFAKIFSDLYDYIAEYYKIFDRLKEIAGALAIAKYIYDNHYPIDYNLIEKIYESTLIQNYSTKVRAIYHYGEKIFEDYQTLSLSEATDIYLKENKMQRNQYNAKMAQDYLINNNIEYKRRKSFQKFVYGGIDLWTGLIENEKNIINESINSISTTNDENSNIKLLSVQNNQLNFDLTNFNFFEFPLLIKNRKCSICNIDLNLSELKINQKYKNNYNTLNTQYCKKHNPFNCSICNKLITKNLITIEGDNYHQKCVKCIYCQKILLKNICKCDEGFIHKKCLEDYNNDILEKDLKYIYENCPNCEFCDEKIMDEYTVINNYKIHSNCFEKIKKKGVDQGKIYILEGITSTCYICKKLIIEDGLRTINGLSHADCLYFTMFIIYAFFDILNKNRNYYYN